VSQRVSTGLLNIEQVPSVSITDPTFKTREFMLLMICVLLGSGLWICIATLLSLPISTTHSVIGSVILLGMYCNGIWSVNYGALVFIVIGWVLSPVLGFATSFGLWKALRVLVIDHHDHTNRMFESLPYLVGFTTFILLLFVIYILLKSIPILSLIGLGSLAATSSVPTIFITAPVSLLLALLVTLIVKFVVNPYLKKKIEDESFSNLEMRHAKHSSSSSSNANSDAYVAVMSGEAAGNDETNVVVVKAKQEDNGEGNINNTNEPSSSVTANDIEAGDGNVHQRKKLLAATDSVDSLNNLDTEDKDSLASLEDMRSAMKDDFGAGLSSSAGHEEDASLDEAVHHLISSQNKYVKLVESYVFNVLVIITSCCIATAHGSNDIGNASGPLTAVILAYYNGAIPTAADAGTFWSTLVVSLALVIGLSLFGYKVMQTVGEKITKLTPARAFVAQICTSTIILCSSLMGLPLSTTHILVGTVLGISCVDAGNLQAMNWKVISSILMSWIVTIPCSGIMSVVSFAVLRYLL